jgi:hypothetical protein
MKRHILIALATNTALLVAGGIGTLAAALPPGTVLESSVETTTDAVIFPSSLQGRLQVRGCEGCAHSVVQTDEHTQFIVAGETVSLHDMAQYALRNPGHALTIHYLLKSTVATLVTVLVR